MLRARGRSQRRAKAGKRRSRVAGEVEVHSTRNMYGKVFERCWRDATVATVEQQAAGRWRESWVGGRPIGVDREVDMAQAR